VKESPGPTGTPEKVAPGNVAASVPGFSHTPCGTDGRPPSMPQVIERARSQQLVGRRHDRGSQDTLVLLDRVDFATWLLTRRDDSQVATRFDRHFGALVAEADLSDMYLARDQDVRRAAARLFVHPNTVRYRLGKVERLLGAPIASASLVANLYLAFQDQILALGPG